MSSRCAGVARKQLLAGEKFLKRKSRFAQAAMALGDQGICVWDGDFYAARPVQVLGLAERGGLLRTGVSMYNTREELNRLLSGLERLAA